MYKLRTSSVVTPRAAHSPVSTGQHFHNTHLSVLSWHPPCYAVLRCCQDTWLYLQFLASMNVSAPARDGDASNPFTRRWCPFPALSKLSTDKIAICNALSITLQLSCQSNLLSCSCFNRCPCSQPDFIQSIMFWWLLWKMFFTKYFLCTCFLGLVLTEIALGTGMERKKIDSDVVLQSINPNFSNPYNKPKFAKSELYYNAHRPPFRCISTK